MLQVSNKNDNISANNTILELGSKRKTLSDTTYNTDNLSCPVHPIRWT